jgi:hypothetical protein
MMRPLREEGPGSASIPQARANRSGKENAEEKRCAAPSRRIAGA